MNKLLSFGAALALVLACTAERAEATEYMFTLIDYPGATHTYAFGINDSGQIVGQYEVGGRSHGFTWSGGVYTSFDHPSAASGGSGAHDINNSGQIVGWYDTVGSNNLAGYLRDGDDYLALTAFGSDWTEAGGINDSATVVGWYRDAGDVYRGFLFDGSSYTTLNDPDAVHTYPDGINNAGVIVGQGRDSAFIPNAFIRDASGDFTNFYVDGFPAAAVGINDLGQIVGGYGPAADDHWGFVLTGGVNATPDKLVPPGAPITDAWDINNVGQVVGSYTNGTFADGPYRGFLATPIPDIPGDYNRNGVVDAADYTVWRDTLGSTFDMRANGDNSGASAHLIDAADYDMWRAHVGETTGTTGSASADGAIPEPAGLWPALIALAGGTLAIRRRFATTPRRKGENS